MSKISRICIAMMAAALMLVCGGDMYAYKADIVARSDLTGHRHIVIEALKLFLSEYPNFHELDDLRTESDAVQSYTQRVYGPTEIICDTVLTVFPVREERTLGMGHGEDRDNYGEVIAWGAQNEDEYDYVYEFPFFGGDLYCGAQVTRMHFWDADLGPTAATVFGLEDFFSDLIGFSIGYPNAWQKVAIPETDFTDNNPSLWDQAISAYSSNKTKAYERLGHVVHLLQDGTVPAHAHIDSHGPTLAFGFLDAYEQWSIFKTGADDLSEWYVDRSGFEPTESTLIDMPEEFEIFLAVQDKGWLSGVPIGVSKLELFYLFYTANQHGDYFDSWRSTGGALSKSGDANIISFLPGRPAAIPWIDYNDGSWGSPNAHVLDEVAEKSYLHAIRGTATVFEVFLMQVGELPPRPGLVCPPDITLPCGSETKVDITGVATVANAAVFDPFPVPVVTFSDGIDFDDMGRVARITRTWTATNEFGFTETCDQIITIDNTVPPTIFLSGTGTDLGIDNDADGAFDNLQVNLDIFLLNAHNLSLSARLIDSDGHTIDISSNDFGFFPLGPATISLSFDGDKIGEHGVDGPYTVVDLVFRGSECDAFSVDYITDTYAASEFSGFAGASGQTGAGGNGGCFVATAAYGTPMATDINVLRHFRDEALLTSRLGTLFVDGYYRLSPPLADFVAQHPAAASTVRVALIPVLFVLSSPWTVAAMVLLLAGALLVGRQVRGARHRSITGISFLILALFAFSTPVQAHVALIDVSGLEFLIDTDFHGSTSTTSSEAVEASYIAPVPADTASGGVTMLILDDAFDGYGALKIFAGGDGRVTYGNNGPATLIDGGRSILFSTEAFGEFDEVLVTREVFVPEDDEFCRWLTRIQNVDTETVFVLVSIRGDLGSDDLTRIHATASGDTSAGADDNWVVSFEDFVGDSSSDPRLGHVFQNSGARVQLTAMRFGDGDDEPSWDYELEILPGEVQTLMHFVTGQPTLSDAVLKAQQLEALQGSALDFMSAEEISQVVNFAPRAPGALLLGAATGLDSGKGLSTLYSIDPDTGEATEMGPIGFGNVTGMAFVGDRLFATANGDSLFGIRTAILIEINPLNGEGTLVGVVDDDFSGLCGRMPDITYDPLANILFAYSERCVDSDAHEGLWTIDPETGEGTPVGPSGFTNGGNGLAVQPGTGTLFATPRDDRCLVTIDRNTGAGTCIEGSEGNVTSTVNALDFHPLTGVLYGSQKFFDFDLAKVVARLVVIDVLDGTTISIGETVLGLDAIVFTPEAAGATAQNTFNSGSPCFVATAAYGTPMAEDINVLRHFRDEVLLTSLLGTLFVDSYYRTSPQIAEFVAQHPAAASTVRIALIPLLFVLSSPWTAAAMVLLLASAFRTTVRRVRAK